MAKKNWKSDVFGGQILLSSGILRHTKFILYVFFLVIVYISIKFGVEKSAVVERRNQRELKNLKAEYTGKRALLLYQSKRIEVEKSLKKYDSKLKYPTVPPVIIEIKGDEE